VTYKALIEKTFASARHIVFRSVFFVIALMLAGGIATATKALRAWQNSPVPIVASIESAGTAVETPRAVQKHNHKRSRKLSPLTPRGAIALATALAATSGSALYGRNSILSEPGRATTSLSASTTRSAPAQESLPMLITEVDTSRAIAFDTATLKAEPFTSTTSLPWSPFGDRQTRISLFAMNIGPVFGDDNPSSMKAEAVDFAGFH